MDYRAYILNDKGGIVEVREFYAPDDAAAIVQAKTYVNGHDVELWQLDRKVARLPRHKH